MFRKGTVAEIIDSSALNRGWSKHCFVIKIFGVLALLTETGEVRLRAVTQQLHSGLGDTDNHLLHLPAMSTDK